MRWWLASVGAAALVAAASAPAADEVYSPQAYVTTAIVSTFYGLTPGARYMLYTEVGGHGGYVLGDSAKTVNAFGRVQWIDELDYFPEVYGRSAEACLYPEGSLVTDPPAVDSEGRELCGETTW